MRDISSKRLSIVDTAKQNIHEIIRMSVGIPFDSIRAAELAKQANPMTSLCGRAAFTSLVQDKEKAEGDAAKIDAMKVRYAKWSAADCPVDDLLDEYGFEPPREEIA